MEWTNTPFDAWMEMSVRITMNTVRRHRVARIFVRQQRCCLLSTASLPCTHVHFGPREFSCDIWGFSDKRQKKQDTSTQCDKNKWVILLMLQICMLGATFLSYLLFTYTISKIICAGRFSGEEAECHEHSKSLYTAEPQQFWRGCWPLPLWSSVKWKDKSARCYRAAKIQWKYISPQQKETREVRNESCRRHTAYAMYA